MSEENKELKPCPFCGEDPKIMQSGNEGIESYSQCSLGTHQVGPIDSYLWQNAYCWKEIARLKELVQVKNDTIDSVREEYARYRKEFCESVTKILDSEFRLKAENAKQRDLINRLEEALRKFGEHQYVDNKSGWNRCTGYLDCICGFEEALDSAQQFLASETPKDGTGVKKNES